MSLIKQIECSGFKFERQLRRHQRNINNLALAVVAGCGGDGATFIKFRMVSEVLSGKDAAANVRAALEKEVDVLKVRRVTLGCTLLVGNEKRYSALCITLRLHIFVH